jgi:hypothetical protein
MKRILSIAIAALISVSAFAEGTSTSARNNGLIVQQAGNIGRYQHNGEQFTGWLFAMDMPRTFESGSCIAAGGFLVQRNDRTEGAERVTFYCWEKTTTGHTMSFEPLEDASWVKADGKWVLASN